MTIKASVAFIFNNLGQILLLKRNETDFWMPGKWGLPGGKVDKGETHEDAVFREVKEEAGLNIFAPKCVYHRQDGKYDIKYFSTRNFYGKVAVDLTEHSDHKWIYIKDIVPEECTPDLRTLAMKYAS